MGVCDSSTEQQGGCELSMLKSYRQINVFSSWPDRETLLFARSTSVVGSLYLRRPSSTRRSDVISSSLQNRPLKAACRMASASSANSHSEQRPSKTEESEKNISETATYSEMYE